MPKIIKKEKGIKPEHYFVLCTGGIIKDFKELAFMLDHMSEHEFRHHVNNARNDFSNWARDVFQENNLAEQLRKTQDRKDIQIILLKYLVNQKR